MSEPSWRPMRSVTSTLSILGLMASLLWGATGFAAESAFIDVLRSQVRAGGFQSAAALYRNNEEHLVPMGKIIFESKGLSLNGNVSCQTCHLIRFGSSDGVPIAAAIGGKGEGPQRLLSGAKLLPRNTLPFWGRGGKGFDIFFWDGRVDFSGSRRLSQFGANPPSADSLVTAAHLPVVQIREMLDEDEFVRKHKRESVERAAHVYKAIADNLRRVEPAASRDLSGALGKAVDRLTYTDYARAIAAFIRSEFRIKETKLERFVIGTERLADDEVRGGILFYGKGRCVVCHRGPYFSDFRFHAVGFPQLGFGANGFGVDYGRFNVTFDPHDRYNFRTPPLYNVEKTAPYGHSGSVATLEEAVIAHFDPLRLVKLSDLDGFARHEFYKRLTVTSETANAVGYLSDEEVKQVTGFLKTLSF
jgi:cytochrome c peroxidase